MQVCLALILFGFCETKPAPSGPRPRCGRVRFHPDQVGSGLLVAIIGAAIIVGSGAATAIAHALVMILVTAAVVIALTIAGGITYLGAQSRTGQPDTGLMTVERLAARRAEALGEQPARPQLETGDRHFPACPVRGVSPQASGGVYHTVSAMRYSLSTIFVGQPTNVRQVTPAPGAGHVFLTASRWLCGSQQALRRSRSGEPECCADGGYAGAAFVVAGQGSFDGGPKAGVWRGWPMWASSLRRSSRPSEPHR